MIKVNAKIPLLRTRQCFWLAGVILCAVFQVGCANLPQRPAENNWPSEDDAGKSIAKNFEDTSLYQLINPNLDQHPGQSGFYALHNGIDALSARLELIAKAESSIDLQYYIWHHDEVGNALFQALLAAADRGVYVRLLLDDLDTIGKDEVLVKIDAHPNIEIRLFNPFPNRSARWVDFLTSTKRVNRRMHNKSIAVDGSIAVLGGRNIGNEYFDAGEVGFSDMDVAVVGPVVKELNESFALYWNSDWTYPLRQLVKVADPSQQEIQELRARYDAQVAELDEGDYVAALRQSLDETLTRLNDTDFSWGRWVLVYDQPEKVVAKKVDIGTHLAPRLKKAIDATASDLIIVSPYFVPGPDFTQYLVSLVERGVRVRIMTNSLAANDVSLVHAGYRRYREDLVKGGIELYEFKPLFVDDEKDSKKNYRWIGSSRASLHGKYFAFDEKYMFIGSFNLDGRSVSLNTELGVYFESENYAGFLSENFDDLALRKGYRVILEEDELRWETLENGERVVFSKEPETNWWQRSVNRFISIFVPEAQL